MSSSNLNNFRKRRFAFPTSHSCNTNEDAPPVKIKKRKGNPYIPRSIISRVRNLLDWISDLPLTEYFISSMKIGAMLPESPPASDDEDDVTILDDDNDDAECQILGERKKKFSNQNNVSKRNVPIRRKPELPKNYNPFSVPVCPLSASSSSSFPQNFLKKQALPARSRNSVHQRRINGSLYQPDISLSCTKFQPKPRQKLPSANHITPITNPGTDIQILFEANQKTVLEEKELEIVTEISTGKQGAIVSRNNQTPRTSRPCHNNTLSEDIILTDEIQIPTQKSPRKQYTAHEVVRLQERAQYQLLLDKYTKGSLYHTRKPPPNAIEAEEEKFLSENIRQFLDQYHIPNLIAKQEALKQSMQSSEKAESKAESEDDDEIKVLKTIRLPKYKPKMRTKAPMFSAEWMAELKRTISIQTEERLQIEAEREQQLEQYRKERAAKHAAEMQERDQLKLVGGVHPGIIVEEEEDSLELSAEMEATIEKALAHAAADDKLSSIGLFGILRKDIDTLAGLNWLNDEIINYYMALIEERSKLDNYPSVYAFNSFVYGNLKTKGYSSVRRWTRRVDIFSYDLNLMPLHLGVHWGLAVVDHRVKTISYYDSMAGGEEICLDIINEYLVDEKRDKKGEILDKSTYSLIAVKDIPRQMNGSDCGMFTLKYAEYVARDAEITFTQKHMQYFRRRMIYEVLTNKIL